MKLKLTVILLICLMLASCGGDGAPVSEQAAENGAAAEDIIQEAADDYIFPDLNCGGADFTFLNMSTDWGFYTDLVHESVTGEILDDAIYTRNRTIEDKFNVNIKEVPLLVDDVTPRLRSTVMAGDDIYDASYIPCNTGGNPIGAMITQKLLYNLNEVAQLNLDQDWWNQSIKQDSAIGSSGSLYFAFSDMNIMPLQCAYCIYINEDIMTDLGLDLPYQLVKEGKWTYDALHAYMKAGAQLNGGAEAFGWELDGPAVYGYTSFEGGTLALLTASGERGVSIDNGGMPYLTYETERFFNAVDKLGEMLNTRAQGEYLTANTYSSGFHFELIFRNERAMMMGGELKASDSFRDMDSTYGIVPMPKFDDSQSRYYTAITVQAPVLVIPVTNNNLESTGIILDAMAYLSARDITPVFFDITMSQKRLRNEESIEMLQIIRDTLYFDIGFAYGWTNNIAAPIRDSLDSGRGGQAVTTLERQLERSRVSMEQTMELIEQD